MTAEELLKTLRDGGLDDESIKKLLDDAKKILEPEEKAEEDRLKAEEEDEKAEAEKLLGVTL